MSELNRITFDPQIMGGRSHPGNAYSRFRSLSARSPTVQPSKKSWKGTRIWNGQTLSKRWNMRPG